MTFIRNKKRLRKVLFATLCLTLVFTLGTVLCFAADTGIDGEAILAEIVSLLVSGISDFGTGLAQGINGFVQSLFISASGGLSTTGIVVVIFAGIALVTGITALIWNWITTLGARK